MFSFRKVLNTECVWSPNTFGVTLFIKLWRAIQFSPFIYLDNCLHPLGMKDGRITNGQITVSSEHVNSVRTYDFYGAKYARLDTMETGSHAGGWVAGVLDANQWIQINLRGVMWVSGVMIQGRNYSVNQRVTEFKVLYKMYGMDWATVQTPNKQDMVRN